MQQLQYYMMITASVLICLSVHEASHALASCLLGDKTAKNQGRLTLNPMAHIDPLGLIAMILFRFGWAKPVPVNFRNLKNPKRDSMIISFAGPLSNFVLATIMYLLGGILIMTAYNDITIAIFQFLATTASISIGLGIFNLIPIPPLDGSNIVIPLLPRKWQQMIVNNAQFIQFGLILALWTNFLSYPLSIARSFISNGILSFVDSILILLF